MLISVDAEYSFEKIQQAFWMFKKTGQLNKIRAKYLITMTNQQTIYVLTHTHTHKLSPEAAL